MSIATRTLVVGDDPDFELLINQRFAAGKVRVVIKDNPVPTPAYRCDCRVTRRKCVDPFVAALFRLVVPT